MQGRELRLNKACGTIADFTFEELCDRVSIQSNLDQLTLRLFTVQKKKKRQQQTPSTKPHYFHKLYSIKRAFLNLAKDFELKFNRKKIKKNSPKEQQ